MGYDYPAAEHPLWTALFGGISYSAWALLAYSYRKGHSGTSTKRISKGKVPRFLYIYTNGAFGADFPQIVNTMKKLFFFIFSFVVCILGFPLNAQEQHPPWEVACGTEILITATAKSGYRFVQWSDGDATNPRSIIVDSNLTLSAIFVAEKPTNTSLTPIDEKENVQKILINNHIYIIRGGKTYTITGVLVNEQ